MTSEHALPGSLRGLLRSEIAFALLARGTQAATMLAAALCVAWRFGIEEQGLFFVFMSLGALLQLCDFGLSYAVLQTASHLMATGAKARLRSFRSLAMRMNASVLVCGSGLIGVLGALIVSSGTDVGQASSPWLAPWIGFVIAIALAQWVNLEVVLMEGVRPAIFAWRFRFLQESLGGLVFIGALLGGAGLWSLCAYWVSRAALASLWCRHDRFPFLPPAISEEPRMRWRKEVWPFQWRIGLSGLSGFLIFQAFNPIVLVEQGTAAAARFGMSLAMMNMLLLVTTVWPASQVSRYVGLIAVRRFEEARRAFWRMLAGSSALAACLALGLMSAVWWIGQRELSLAGRLADVATTGALLFAAVVHHVVNCFAVLLRAERNEPLLPVSVFGGLLTVSVVWLSAHYGQLRDVALANLGCALIGIPIVLFYYRRFAGRMPAVER